MWSGRSAGPQWPPLCCKERRGVESSLPLSYTCHLCISRWRCLASSGHEEQKKSNLASSDRHTAARLLCPVATRGASLCCVLNMWSGRSAGAVASPTLMWRARYLPLSYTCHLCISRWRCLPLVTKKISKTSKLRPRRASVVSCTRGASLVSCACGQGGMQVRRCAISSR